MLDGVITRGSIYTQKWVFVFFNQHLSSEVPLYLLAVEANSVLSMFNVDKSTNFSLDCVIFSALSLVISIGDGNFSFTLQKMRQFYCLSSIFLVDGTKLQRQRTLCRISKLL